MRIRKENTAFGERVNIRCLNARITSKAPEPIVHVVDRQKQNVGSLFVLRQPL